MNNESKFKTLSDISKNSKHSEWCSVDIHNNFKFKNLNLKISEEVAEYRVYNKAWEKDDFTNESKMDKILVIIDESHAFKFYDENIKEIDTKLVEVTP